MIKLLLVIFAGLAACASTPDISTEPYVETDVLQVIVYDPVGKEGAIYIPKDGQITVYPREEKITLVDQWGRPQEIRRSEKSYSVILDR